MTDIISTIKNISNATSKKLIEASINNNLDLIEKLVNAGADPYNVFGKYLEKSPVPFREWFNEYLHRWSKYINSTKTDKENLIFISNFLKLDTLENLKTKSFEYLENLKLISDNILKKD